MKYFVCFCTVLFFFTFKSKAQSAYWQQQVNYTIDVTLTDKNHILHGFENIEYINNSPDTLKFIYIHLYPNAYKNDKQAFTEQQVEDKKTDFYYSKANEKGFIDSLNFEINDKACNISEYNNYADIIILELPNPLLPHEKINISTSFRVVIPKLFSRLGHIREAYYISQWYPKPAVYDKDGWHPMPYLDQGEFYSEYGNYTVNITLPSNYVVAATGDLQTPSEIQFIKNILSKTDTVTSTSKVSSVKLDSFPTSSSTLKTIQFNASQVHDFAWFADKRFLVSQKDTITQAGNTVSCYSYYLPSHKNIYKNSTYITAATIAYLSKHVGNYPYKHATVVDGELEAGGGMEYPTITVLGKTKSAKVLQTVIIHEVGHNWFYGLLGSNERDHAWMDEGVNSFYESKIDQYIDELHNTKRKKQAVDMLPYWISAKQHEDQAIAEKSYNHTPINYGGIVYKKSQMVFSYLEQYLGKEVFEQCMKNYFDAYHLKHPSPDDFIQIFIETSKQDLSWFFNTLIQSNLKLDFAIQQVKRKDLTTIVKIKHNTKTNIPLPVSACIKDSIVSTIWKKANETEVTFNLLPKEVNNFKLNAQHTLPEMRINNNVYGTSKLMHNFFLKLKLGSSFSNYTKNTLHIMPTVGYNQYNTFCPGIAIHNIKIPNEAFQFYINPMYSFSSKSIVGFGGLAYSFFPKNKIQKLTVGTKVQSFHADRAFYNDKKSLLARYIKINPFVRLECKKENARSSVQNSISVESYFIQEQSFQYNFDSTSAAFKASYAPLQHTAIYQAKFIHADTRKFNPYSYSATLQGNTLFAKITLEGNAKVDYFKKNKALYVRGFIGKFIDTKQANSIFDVQKYYLQSTNNGLNNYLYNDMFWGRNINDGFSAKQIAVREGGFKVNTAKSANPIGMTNDWLFTLNVKSDLPISLPFFKPQLYLNMGTFTNAKRELSSGANSIMEGGLELHFTPVLSIYIPLVLSADFKNYTKSIYPERRSLQAISFSLNLSELDIFNTQKTAIKVLGY